MHMNIHTLMYIVYIHTYVCIYIYIHMYIQYTYIYVCICTNIYLFILACIYVLADYRLHAVQ